jgi:WD40 repeat protein
VRGMKLGIVHVSTGSSRMRPLVRSAIVVTLVFMSVTSFPGVASAMPGAKLWGQRFNGPKNRADQAYALGVSPDGSTLFVAGASVGLTTGADYATVAYDASTGSPIWTKRYNGPGSRADHALVLGVSPDGSTVFVTGSSFAKATGLDYATVAYDASTSARLWTKRYASLGSGDDIPKGLEVSPDGSNVFVTGWSNFDYATVAYDASTGAKLWAMRFNGSANSYDDALALGVRPDGSEVFVAGSSLGSTTGLDYATVDYDASTGAKAWTKLYNGPGNAADDATALGVSPDGSQVFVTGLSAGSTTGWDYATAAYSAA